MKSLYQPKSPSILPPMLDRVGSEFESSIPIQATTDIVTARRIGRDLADLYGASDVQATLVATIISELARNILLFAGSGKILLVKASEVGRSGISVTAEDGGPGIRDLQRALLGGYSTCGRLGLGLSGVRRMADEFDVSTGPTHGTTVFARKWFR